MTSHPHPVPAVPIETRPAAPYTPDTTRTIAVVREMFAGGKTSAVAKRVVDAVQDGHRAIVLDFRDCPYLNASEMGVLVSCAKAVHTAEPKGTITLAGVHEDLRTLLDLTKIATMFDGVRV